MDREKKNGQGKKKEEKNSFLQYISWVIVTVCQLGYLKFLNLKIPSRVCGYTSVDISNIICVSLAF